MRIAAACAAFIHQARTVLTTPSAVTRFARWYLRRFLAHLRDACVRVDLHRFVCQINVVSHV